MTDAVLADSAASPQPHDDHHDDPMSHVPPPSFWPVLIGGALILFSLGALGWMKAGGFMGIEGSWLFILGGVLTAFTTMGWAHQIIKEKKIAHDINQQQVDLKLFIKCFLVSEFMVFVCIFFYYYARLLTDADFHPPEWIHLGGAPVVFATALLLSSSITCEFAHHALMHKNKAQARMLLLATLALGTIFLMFTGYEYGLLIEKGFSPAALNEAYPNNGYASHAAFFFASTGFHALHVAMGLVMLFLVYLRLETGHFTKERHFSMIAASWYWHFVDIVWILLFVTVYVAK